MPRERRPNEIMAIKKKLHKPGQKCRVSGQYTLTTGERQATVTKGEPFPPTPRPGVSWKLTDFTR